MISTLFPNTLRNRRIHPYILYIGVLIACPFLGNRGIATTSALSVDSLAAKATEWHTISVEAPPQASDPTRLTRYVATRSPYLTPGSDRLSADKQPAFRQTTAWMTAQSLPRQIPIHRQNRHNHTAALRQVTLELPQNTTQPIHSAARIPTVIQITAVDPPSSITFPNDAERLGKIREIAALHLDPNEMALLDQALKTASFPESLPKTSTGGVTHATYAVVPGSDTLAKRSERAADLQATRSDSTMVSAMDSPANASAGSATAVTSSTTERITVGRIPNESLTAMVSASSNSATPASAVSEGRSVRTFRFTPESIAYWNAILTASGVSDSTLLAKMRQQLRNLDATIPVFSEKPSPYDADLLLAHLYRECFQQGYQTSASELNAPLERGEFNCVSGTLLYYGLAKQRGWTVQALVSTGHMRCQVQTTQGNYIVETTTYPTRFQSRRPSSIRTAATTSRSRTRNVSGVSTPIPPQNEERAVDSLPILEGVLFYNRAIQAMDAGNLDQSLSYAAASVYLDPDSTAAKSNFLASLNNSAIRLAEAGNTEQARQWLRTAQELAPDHPVLAENYQRLLQQCQGTPK